jgi:hypothetical protein
MKKTKVLVVILVVFGFCIQGFAEEVSETSKLAVTVIDVDDQGYFNYYGKVSKLIKRGQGVFWICNSPFAIYYGNHSPLVLNAKGKAVWGKITKGLQSKPLDAKKIQQLKEGLSKIAEKACMCVKKDLESVIKKLNRILKKKVSEEYHIVKAWISTNALSGKYKYIVAAFRDGKIWVDDPEDIVDPPRR